MSKQIRKILVPLDGSRNSMRAFGKALHLAQEHEAALTVLHVRNSSKISKRLEKSAMKESPSFYTLTTKSAK